MKINIVLMIYLFIVIEKQPKVTNKKSNTIQTDYNK